MWVKQSLFKAVDEDGNELFIDVDIAGNAWIRARFKCHTPTPLQMCDTYKELEEFDRFIESENAAERNFYFMQGATCWR